jgi:hypothetical protein
MAQRIKIVLIKNNTTNIYKRRNDKGRHPENSEISDFLNVKDGRSWFGGFVQSGKAFFFADFLVYSVYAVIHKQLPEWTKLSPSHGPHKTESFNCLNYETLRYTINPRPDTSQRNDVLEYLEKSLSYSRISAQKWCISNRFRKALFMEAIL